ncbi:hypothetical protein B0F90DRAFT_1811119 [Multifurca ochricompacta]|uniref:Fungal lipase-type domain-containing protein n=1 Tax=Multifurca ochricompacta TaxID=376703 RepID=A0AAD4QJ63_9AGAM|nr:hypothetical protein B0F90DRAFT_1811119 [Multifurca ochricompacta]
MFPYILAALALFEFARAAVITERETITPLTTSQIEAFKPYSFYAAAAYCLPSKTLTWSCGGNPGFQPFASGGDGSAVQFWYIGWDPTLSSVIVAHQGTNPTSIGFAAEQAKTASTILTAVETLLTRHGSSSVITTGHSLGAAIAFSMPNKHDPIAIVPGEFLGFTHPAGEIHIGESGDWLCTVGDTPGLLEGNILDHLGPYDDNIFMGLCL